jgi:SNF2 family DNA or RNA helicase
MLLTRHNLRPYQNKFVDVIIENEGIILALPMGSGKTTTTLTAVSDLLDSGEVKKCLIVAPKNVAVATWPDEIEEWEHLQHLEWSLLRIDDDDAELLFDRDRAYKDAKDIIGLEPERAAKFAARRKTAIKEWMRQGLAIDDKPIHFINKEALVWLWEFFGSGKDWPYDMMVVDEASMFKNAKMRTAKKGITRYGVAVKSRKFHTRVVELTGTPAPKGLINLFGLAKVADGGERLGDSLYQYKQRYFDTDYMGWNLTPKDWAEEAITERLREIMFSMTEEQCNPDLPPRIDNVVKVHLSKKVMSEYERFERTLISEQYDVEAVNKGVLTGKLLQYANGSMYNEDRDDVWIHDEKLEALEDIIDAANGAPVLVAYSYRFDLKRIMKKYKKAEVFGVGDVRNMKKRWNNGEIDLLLAHPNSIGHGQNIQKGGNISVWYGLTPDLELYQQFNKRLHRDGQTASKVWNHHIVAVGTHDENILPILTQRDATQDRIIQATLMRLDQLTV